MWWGDIKTLNIWKEKEEPKTKEDTIQDDDIEKLNLSSRAFNRLRRNNCYTIKDVLKLMEERGLERISGLGEKSKDEIKEKIKLYIQN